MKKIINSLLKSELQSKIAIGVFWSFFGTFISKGFVLIAFVLIARIISVEKYGELGIIKSFIATFTLFSLGSFGVTATKYLAIYRNENKVKASEILSLTRISVLFTALLIVCIILIFSKYISTSLLGNSNLYLEVKISSIAIFFSSLNGFQIGALSGLEKFKQISIINILNGIISLPILILLAYYFEVIGVVVGLSIINFILWVSSAIYLQREIKKEDIVFCLNNFKENLKIIRDFSLPSFLSSLTLSPVILICNSLLVNESREGYLQMAYYDAAYNFSYIIITINMVIGQVLYPYAMKLYGVENKNFEFLNVILPWALGIFISLPLLIFPDFLSSFFGESYNNSNMHITISIIISFTLIISHRQGIARNFAAANYMWWSLLGNLFWGIMAIVFTTFFLHLGARGRALSFLIAYAFNTLVFIPFYINRKLVSKKLILNKYNYLILLLVILGVFVFYVINNIYSRILSLSLLYIIIFNLLNRWRKDYVK